MLRWASTDGVTAIYADELLAFRIVARAWLFDDALPIRHVQVAEVMHSYRKSQKWLVLQLKNKMFYVAWIPPHAVLSSCHIILVVPSSAYSVQQLRCWTQNIATTLPKYSLKTYFCVILRWLEWSSNYTVALLSSDIGDVFFNRKLNYVLMMKVISWGIKGNRSNCVEISAVWRWRSEKRALSCTQSLIRTAYTS